MSINNKPDFVKKFPSYFDSRNDIKANREEGTKNSFKHLWSERKVSNVLKSMASFGLYYIYLRCWKAPKFYEKNSRAYICLNHLKELADFSSETLRIDGKANHRFASGRPQLDIYKTSEQKLVENLEFKLPKGSKVDTKTPLEKWQRTKKTLAAMPTIFANIEKARDFQDQKERLSPEDKKKITAYALNFVEEISDKVKLKDVLDNLQFANLFDLQLSAEKYLSEKTGTPIALTPELCQKNWAQDLSSINAKDPRGGVLSLFSKDEGRSSLAKGVYPIANVSSGNPLDELRKFKENLQRKYPTIHELAFGELDRILQLVHSQASSNSVIFPFLNTWDLPANLLSLGDNNPGAFDVKVSTNVKGNPKLSIHFKNDVPLYKKSDQSNFNHKGKMGTLALEYTYTFELKDVLPAEPTSGTKTSFDYWTFGMELNSQTYKPLV